MKTKFFFIIVQLLILLKASAQEIKPTSTGTTCQYCMPSNGWTNDAAAISFSVSNERYYAGLLDQSWSPAPDGPAPSYLGSFLTAQPQPNQPAVCHTNLTGLTANKTYYLKYSIMSSKRAGDAGYAESGKVELATVSNGIPTPFIDQSVTYIAGLNTSTWVTKVLKFTPPSSNVRLTFSAIGASGFVNLDIGFNALTECLAGTDQVSLSAITMKTKCAKGADLTSLVQGNAGATVSIVWFKNATHTGEKYNQPNAAEPGTYYAFKYHDVLQCYNTDNSTAKVTVEPGCFDLSPSLDINGLSFSQGQSRDFVVNVFEVKGASTDTATIVKISKPGGFEITYPTQSGVSNVFGGKANENSNWIFSENVNFITAIRNSLIPASNSSVIGFTMKRKTGVGKGLTQNITAVIAGGASGENDSSNNTVITSVSTN
ncbi:hypothetical protein [Dyadobacter sp. Leaf189]|uniref:hypothetical protein n=1 Tax=Dyadobacter sp. Leaf189 TaxID=1736295 RepID=UPI0006FA047B|nr:hypothetical protein [Dyadobacter sp. Leaf189]KQS26986.1 hypothetical protein ASG33_20835 [Dyadobacter sp. Leaf189]